MRDSRYNKTDVDARENHQAKARQLLIDNTRKNLEANLTKAGAELVNRDVFIDIIYSLVAKPEDKKNSLAIDEERLIETVLTVAHKRQYGSQIPGKNDLEITVTRSAVSA